MRHLSEWACYVLDFLLKEGLELGIGAAVHKPEIFNALVQYLCFPGVPYKRKVMSLLLQLLQSPSLFPTKPDLDSLKRLVLSLRKDVNPQEIILMLWHQLQYKL